MQTSRHMNLELQKKIYPVHCHIIIPGPLLVFQCCMPKNVSSACNSEKLGGTIEAKNCAYCTKKCQFIKPNNMTVHWIDYFGQIELIW